MVAMVHNFAARTPVNFSKHGDTIEKRKTKNKKQDALTELQC